VADEAAERFGVASVGIGLDVRDFGAYGAAIEQTRSALGSIGGLVHGAGIPGPSPIDELDESVWDATLAIHLKAAALLIRDLSADLKANPGSAVVLIASIEGVIAHEAIPAYCSAKAGLLGLSRSSAARLGVHGVRVNAVCPGFVMTPMFAPAVAAPAALTAFENRIPLRRLGVPEDIANTIRFLLSDQAAYITAAEIVVDGGVTKTTF
jgi:NAD(P)-dependent dehydrogenase (short-subunit alcohol dehydrogenase family)